MFQPFKQLLQCFALAAEGLKISMAITASGPLPTSSECKLTVLSQPPTYSDLQVVEVVQVVTKTKGQVSDSGAAPKGTLDAPKGTVPLGIGLARTLEQHFIHPLETLCTPLGILALQS